MTKRKTKVGYHDSRGKVVGWTPIPNSHTMNMRMTNWSKYIRMRLISAEYPKYR